MLKDSCLDQMAQQPWKLIWGTIFIIYYLGLKSGSVFRLTELSSELLFRGTTEVTAFAIKQFNLSECTYYSM